MPSTGIAPARELTAPAIVNPDLDITAPKPEVSASVREGAHWFFWIVALIGLDSVFTIMGSHLHRFTGLGITAIGDAFAKDSAGARPIHVIANGWVAGAFLLIAYSASQGKRWAYIAGIAAYSADAGLLIATRDYVSLAFHAFLLIAVFRGFVALDKTATTETPAAASAAHAG